MISHDNKNIHTGHMILLTSDLKNISKNLLSGEEQAYARKVHKELKEDLIGINRLGEWVYIQLLKTEADASRRLENCRKAGDVLCARLNGIKAKQVLIVDVDGKGPEALALAEGLSLSNYQFLRYKTDRKEKQNTLESIGIRSAAIKEKDFEVLNILTEAVYQCRDLINEPVSHLDATTLAKSFQKMGKDAGINVEVLSKARIESLKMGGLLAVNKGSVDPPTFTIMEYSPAKPVNKAPVVLVGKGIVFDTGGLNIKTGNYMEGMKCDMSGAAMMACTMMAAARARLPVHLVGLLPATDNRPSGNAYAPGDVITMHSGATVEVLNTDAEGRMILADALSYAKNYKPMLVIDAATLTGAAARAIGRYGVVAMETKASGFMARLKESGERVYERVAEFPFWEEYGELIKSDVADIKNIGGQDAGMITAGKFLAHFTDYPFIHLDIAGPAFLEKKDSYRGSGGTGFGVRLLFDFLKNFS